MGGMDGFLERHPVWIVVVTLTGLLSVPIVIGGCAGGGSTTASSSSTSVVSSSRRAESTVATTSPAASKTTTAAKRSETAGSAVAALAKLPIKGRAPMTGYSRERFGDGWLTVDGCDTRDRILRRDLSRKTFCCGNTCRVRSGRPRPLHRGGDDVRPGRCVRSRHRPRRRARRCGRRGTAVVSGPSRGVCERSARVALGRRHSPERRRGFGDLATGQQGVPVPLCRAPDRREAQVSRVGHAGRARCHGQGPQGLPDQKLPKSGHAPSPIVAPRRSAEPTKADLQTGGGTRPGRSRPRVRQLRRRSCRRPRTAATRNRRLCGQPQARPRPRRPRLRVTDGAVASRPRRDAHSRLEHG